MGDGMRSHVSAPVLPGVMTSENADRALLAMAVPFVPHLWMVWS